MSATPDDTRKALNNYIKAWATNDKALLMSILSDDAVFCDPVGTPEFVGHEGIGRFWDFSHMGEGRTLTPVLQEIRACVLSGTKPVSPSPTGWICLTRTSRTPTKADWNSGGAAIVEKKAASHIIIHLLNDHSYVAFSPQL
jgi:hypothetical protein